MSEGYNIYRGVGGLSNVDFAAPVATVGAGVHSAAIVAAGHDPSMRYTYVIRPVFGGIERPGMSCVVEFVTDSAGEWLGNRPAGVEMMEAEIASAGKIIVRWTYRTPYNQSPPADFAVYCRTDRDITPGVPEAIEQYVRDGRYCHMFTLDDGANRFFAVSARTAGAVESALSDVIGPLVADASAPPAPTVYISTRFQ